MCIMIYIGRAQMICFALILGTLSSQYHASSLILYIVIMRKVCVFTILGRSIINQRNTMGGLTLGVPPGFIYDALSHPWVFCRIKYEHH